MGQGMDMSSYTKCLLVVAASTTMIGAAGCGGGSNNASSDCTGPKILPHKSPIRFREFKPPPGDEAKENTGDTERVPFASTLLLQSTCSKNVEVSEACLVGEEDQGDNDTKYFTLEGPEPKKISGSNDGAVRITYDRKNPNPGDDVDNVALVVQSNAKNFPTLVVPVCARVVGEGTEDKDRELVECSSPVTVEPGNEKNDLCK